MARTVAPTFNFDLIPLTLKFGFYQRRFDYLMNDPTETLIQRLYQDAERMIYELANNLRNVALIGLFRYELFRIPANEFAMIPITRTIDIEPNSLIEIILVPMENNRQPHHWDRYTFGKLTYCSRCSRLITGIYKQGYRCRSCRMTVHRDCASLGPDDCRPASGSSGRSPGSSLVLISAIENGITPPPTPTPTHPQPLPLPPPSPPSVSHVSPVIERGIFPACIRGAHIYRRYAFFLTRDTLNMSTNFSLINLDQLGEMETVIPLSTIQNIVLTHFVHGHDDVFEIHLQDRTIISVGRRNDSNDLQMETAQFYSSLRDQWEALISATPVPTTPTVMPLQPAPQPVSQPAPPTTSAVLPERTTPPSPSQITEGATANRDEIEFRRINGRTTAPTTNPRPQQLTRLQSNYRLIPKDGGSQDLHELYAMTGDKIGKGQFGRVVAGYRKSTHRPVAIKIIEKTNCDDREIQLINREINHLYEFNHMNILKLEAYFERDNAVYLVTERMETDMCKYILRPPNGYLDEATSRILIYQVIIALRYLHENNCGHLDIKCENILLSLLPPVVSAATNNGVTETQEFPLVKLADFGYSKIIGEHSFRMSRVGTKVYNAPEIYRGEGRYNRLVDMWSVGVVLYAALSGTLPYTEHEIQRIEEIVGNQDQLFSDARWREVSRDAIDLIANNLLVVSADSRNRPNAALFHNWFTDFTLVKNLREIERRAKHMLKNREEQLPNARRWLTEGRADLVWNEYKQLAAAESQNVNEN